MSEYEEYQPVPQRNSKGTRGFVLALCGLVFCWLPIVDLVLFILGLVFSIQGMRHPSKGLAIAGIAISGVNLFILIYFYIFMFAFGLFYFFGY